MTIQAFKVSIQEKLACLDTKGGISENTLLIFSALFIACVFNTSVLGDIANILGINMLQDYLFIASIFISLFLWILFFILLLSIFIPSKYLSLSLIVFSACIAYMQNQYHVIYDENMIRNLFETDLGEASELLSITWLLFIFLAGCLPAYCIFKSPIKKQHFIRAFFGRSLLMLGVILALLINIYAFSDNYSSLLRNNRQIRDQIIPTSFIYSTYQYVKSSLPRIDRKVTAIATDAKLSDEKTSDPKMVFVIVVGETMRAASFGLGGYAKNTTPMLKNRMLHDKGLVYFDQFYSCGTATATSLPCMFSAQSRENFDVDAAKYEQNLLDVLSRTGMDVVWVDNNSGCKGVCLRINQQKISHLDKANCSNDHCFDATLVSELDRLLIDSKKDIVIVLHQQGSHGPAYFERAPLIFHKFQPTCHSRHLPDCSKKEIVNSYDNTVLYTDHVLDKVIEHLDKASDRYATAMLYVSDHGESLGEHNLYLHGMPYSIAPDEQKHVPAVMWFSQRFIDTYHLDMQKLKSKSSTAYSHDNIFHSLLGLFTIKTKIYQSDLDIFYDATKNQDTNYSKLVSTTN